MMKYLYQWFGQDSTWICNTSPVYLKEDEYEYREMKVGYDYPEKADSDIQLFVDTNINIFKKIWRYRDCNIIEYDKWRISLCYS